MRRPPGPSGNPLLGSLPEFRRDPLAFLTMLSERNGRLSYFRAAYQHMYFCNHPDLVQEVLVNRNSLFIKSRILQRAKTLLGEGLLTNEGQSHLRQRRLVQPAFHRERLAGYGAQMVVLAQRASQTWRDGQAIDIDREMMRLTLTIVGRTLFNADVEREAPAVGAAMTDLLGMMPVLMLPFSKIIERLPIPATRRYNAAKNMLDQTIYRIIAERRESGEDSGDLLSMMLLSRDAEGDGGGMTDRQVRDEALTLFLAGHETTATALTWTWYLLAQHPDVEMKLHQELAQVLNGRVPEFDDVPRLPYTEAIFAESLRLYPPAWGIGRMATEDLELDGYTIPAKSILLLSPYVMHRSPLYWPEPNRFLPERWAESSPQRPRHAYFPFGTGPRICIGERFAWTEGILLLASIAQRWRFRLAPGQKAETHALITLRPKGGLRMTATAA